MPACALPQSFRKGKLSYTISSTNTKARIEVLLKQRAFRIVKIGEKDGCYGQEQNGFKGFVCFTAKSAGVNQLSTNNHILVSKKKTTLEFRQHPKSRLLSTFNMYEWPGFYLLFNIEDLDSPHDTPMFP